MHCVISTEYHAPVAFSSSLLSFLVLLSGSSSTLPASSGTWAPAEWGGGVKLSSVHFDLEWMDWHLRDVRVVQLYVFYDNGFCRLLHLSLFFYFVYFSFLYFCKSIFAANKSRLPRLRPGPAARLLSVTCPANMARCAYPPPPQAD
jgi:hypothetical protein